MSQRNQPPRSPSVRPEDELQEAIEEIDNLDSDRPSVEVNITGPHPAVNPQSLGPKRSLIPKALDTPFKRIVACIATLLVAGLTAIVAEVIRQITSK